MKFGIREFVFVALMMGMVAGSYAMVVRPHAQQREEKLAQVRSMESSLANVARCTQGIDGIRQKIEQQQQAITFFQSRLAQEPGVDKVLKELTQMADANSLQTGSAKARKREQAAGYIAQPIQIELSGNFNGFYSFLLQLEKQPRITRIRQMKLEKISDHDGEMKADLTLCVYFEPGDTVDARVSTGLN